MGPTEPKDEIAALEAELRKHPDSLDLHLRLLEAHCFDPSLRDTQRRFELVEWFVRNHPEHDICRTPFCAVEPSRAPEGFRLVRAAWDDALASVPNSIPILRGAGAFLSAEDYALSKRLFLNAVSLAPEDAEAWLDLGRVCRAPDEKLRAFRRARELGHGSPNLLSWLASAALDAGDLESAERFGGELLERVESRRSYLGDAFAWKERGSQLWKRACEVSATEEDARKLVRALSHSWYDANWGHTTLGVVACRRGAIDDAVDHLNASFEITPDHRLAAYGPDPILLRELCRVGRSADVLSVLKRHERMWRDDVADRWRHWIEQVERGELPG